MREDLRPRSAEDRPAPLEEDRGIAQTPQSAPSEIVASVTLTDSVKSVFRDIIVLRF